MPKTKRLRDQWFVPTPFRDGRGSTITVPLNRPTFNSLILLVALANVVDHCTGVGPNTSVWTYAMLYLGCAVVALAGGALVARMTSDERASKICGGGVGLGGFALSGGPVPQIAIVVLLAVAGLLIMIAVSVEAGFRLSRRQRHSGAGDRELDRLLQDHSV
jgi:hypothetical protein